MYKPTVTVIVPTYNRSGMLKRCVNSIVDDIRNDAALAVRVRVIVADDGSSSPDAISALAELEAEIPADLLHIIRLDENSGGAAVPRNAALDMVESDYVFFVDSDDYLGEKAIRRLLHLLEEDQPDYIYLNSVNDGNRTDRSGAITWHYERRDLLFAIRSLVVRRVFRTSVIRRLGLRFDEYLKSGEDIPFAFRFLLNAREFGFAGGYDYYHLTEHRLEGEDGHLSRKGARHGMPPALLAAYWIHILRHGLAALSAADLAPDVKDRIASTVLLARVLPRFAVRLKRIVRPARRQRILNDLADVLASPLFPKDSVRLMTAEQQNLVGITLERDVDRFLAALTKPD